MDRRELLELFGLTAALCLWEGEAKAGTAPSWREQLIERHLATPEGREKLLEAMDTTLERLEQMGDRRPGEFFVLIRATLEQIKDHTGPEDTYDQKMFERCVRRSAARRVFDVREVEERRAFAAYLNRLDDGAIYNEDFLSDVWAQYDGEPTEAASYGVSVLVPRGFAEHVWEIRRRIGIRVS